MESDQCLEKLRVILAPVLKKLDYSKLGTHNKSYADYYAEDPFRRFVEDEWPYYEQVYNWYLKNIPKTARILDVGMFIPVIPLLLAWEGYQVETIEDLSFYDDALDTVCELVQENGIIFNNAKILEWDSGIERYDCVNLLAVVEHLVGSPKELLYKINDVLKEDGRIVFVVPNQARLVRRLGLMFGGISVQPLYRDYFESSYPFEGHHREYVLSEVKYALQSSGFDIELLTSVRYPSKGSFIRKTINNIANILPKTFHQAFFAIGSKS